LRAPTKENALVLIAVDLGDRKRVQEVGGFRMWNTRMPVADSC